MQFTGEKPWSPVTLDVYPLAGAPASTTLYEDDTRTVAYRRGEFRKTLITAEADGSAKTVTVKIGAAQGKFAGALARREWVLRVRRPVDWPQTILPARVTVNGKVAGPAVPLARNAGAMPFGDASGAPDDGVFEIKIPARAVHPETDVVVSFQ
jgi:hypothetical protein